MRNYFFGDRWDAPIVDDAVQVETPVGQICYECAEPIEDGDRGFIRATMREVGKTMGCEPVHAECDLRNVMGHTVGVCSCTGHYGSRADAKLVWQRVGEERGRDLAIRDTRPNPAESGEATR